MEARKVCTPYSPQEHQAITFATSELPIACKGLRYRMPKLPQMVRYWKPLERTTAYGKEAWRASNATEILTFLHTRHNAT